MMRHTLSLTLLVALLVVTSSAQVQKKDVAGIVNYSRVDASVGCGGRVSPAAMTALKAEGYVSVINLRQATEPEADIDAGRVARQSFDVLADFAGDAFPLGNFRCGVHLL